MAGFQFQQFTGGSGPNPAVAGAYQASQSAINDGLATVQPGRFVGSPFAQGLLQRASQGTGISPEAMAAQRRQVSRQATQNEAGQLSAVRQSAASGGFNFSGGLNKAEGDVRARSADTVQQSMDRFLIESEQQKREQESQSLAALMQLYGIEGGLAAQYANIQANRQFPVIPGVTPEGQLPGGGYSFIDPGTGRMVNPPRTPEEWDQFNQERMNWEAQFGGGGGGGYQPTGNVGTPPMAGPNPTHQVYGAAPSPGGILGRLYGQ